MAGAKLNPMDINGPTTSHLEPDYRTPAVNSNVASYSVGRNPQSLSWPIPRYVQPDVPPQPAKTGGKLL